MNGIVRLEGREELHTGIICPVSAVRVFSQCEPLSWASTRSASALKNMIVVLLHSQ